MAAIDRLNTKYFREVKILLAWCSNKRPSLLEDITDFAFYGMVKRECPSLIGVG